MNDHFFSLISDDKNLVIETDRLVLEPTIETHAQAMLSLLLDEALYTFIPQNPPTLGELQQRYRMWSKRTSPDGSEIWLNWVARNRVEDQYIGQFQAGFDERNGFSVAYTIGRSYQRQGYATEGLSGIIEFLQIKMNAQKIRSWVDTRNEPSIRLMKRLEFKQVETIKNADQFKGSWSDEFIFELSFDDL